MAYISPYIPPYLFYTISLDLIIDLPISINNYNAILVIVYKLSKFAYIKLTTKNATLEDIAKIVFKTIVRNYSIPEK